MLLACVVLGLAQIAAISGVGPQSVVRRFCEIDGLGQRVRIDGWGGVAPLVAWSFEPAWDRVVLVASYEVGAPRGLGEGRVGVDVTYSVLGQVSALGFDTTVHVETVTFALEAVQGQWRIVGPPLPPHLFWNHVDVKRLRRSLEAGDLNFLPNTLFVWWMMRSAGWDVPLVSTTELLSRHTYRAVHEPKPGDLVVYLRAGLPYHVGLLEADNQVVSSTLNLGIVRSVVGAFAGEVEYLRLVQPAPGDKATPEATAAPASTPGAASAGAAPADSIRRTPTPAIRRVRRRSTPARRPRRKPTNRTGRHKPRKLRTPSAGGHTPRPDPTPQMQR